MIEWETDETTEQPLSCIAADDQLHVQYMLNNMPCYI